MNISRYNVWFIDMGDNVLGSFCPSLSISNHSHTCVIATSCVSGWGNRIGPVCVCPLANVLKPESFNIGNWNLVHETTIWHYGMTSWCQVMSQRLHLFRKRTVKYTTREVRERSGVLICLCNQTLCWQGAYHDPHNKLKFLCLSSRAMGSHGGTPIKVF